MSLPANLLGLLDACKRRPDDALTRGVLADCLEDMGESARAEFVRLQCSLAAKEPWERNEEDAAREHELATAHRAAWLGALREPGRTCRFERGLVQMEVLGQAPALDGDEVAWVETVRLEPFDWPGDDFFRYPFWQHVARLIVTGDRVGQTLIHALEKIPLRRSRDLELTSSALTSVVTRALAGSPVLAQLERLTVAAHGNFSTLAVLAGSPHVRALRSLTITGSGDDAEGVEKLVAANWFGQMEHLDLSGAKIGSEGVRWLALARPAPPLTRLGLGHTGCDRAGIEALAASPILAGVRHLSLSKAICPGEVLAVLLASPHLGAVERLDLDGIYLNDESCRGLAHAEPLPRLRALDLSFCEIGATGLTRLATSPLLDSVAYLKLNSNDLAGGLAALAHSPHVGNLRALDMDSARLTTDDLAALGDSPLMEQLTRLHMPCNGAADLRGLLEPGRAVRLAYLDLFVSELSDEDIELMFRAGSLPSLTYLDLTDNSLGRDHAARVANWPGLARLRFLGLDFTGFGDECVSLLARSGKLARLVSLSLADNRLTIAALRELERALRPGQLTFLSLMHNPLGDEAARLLAESPAFADLTALNMGGTELSDEGEELLRERFGPAVNFSNG